MHLIAMAMTVVTGRVLDAAHLLTAARLVVEYSFEKREFYVLIYYILRGQWYPSRHNSGITISVLLQVCGSKGNGI